MRRKLSVVAAAAAVAIFMSPSPATAAATVGIAVPGSFAAGYGTPQVVTTAGTEVTFLNLDVQFHNIVSKAKNGSGAPLFASKLINTGESAPVVGTKNLPAGTYEFFCAPHPGTMQGVLTVV